jgi:hypothetical protein
MPSKPSSQRSPVRCLSAAEGRLRPTEIWTWSAPPVAHIVRALALTADALAAGAALPRAALEEITQAPFPDALYRLAGDLGFRWQAHRLGTAQRELRATPFEER